MKKVLIVLVVFMMASMSVSAAEVFSSDDASLSIGGRLKTAGGYDGEDYVWEDQGSRITIEGTRTIADGIFAFATYELGFDPLSPGTGFGQRLGYLGVDINGHVISAGQQWSLWDDLAGLADFTEVTGGIAIRNDRTVGGSRSKGMSYRGDFDVVEVATQIQYENGDNDWSAGATVGTSLGALNLLAGVQYASVEAGKLDSDGMHVGFENATLVGLAAEYKVLDNLTLAAAGAFEMYDSQYRVSQETGVKVTLDANGSSLFAGNNFAYDLEQGEIDTNFITVGGTYNILPGSSFYMFAEAKFDVEDVKEDSEFWVGARYSF
ncbi:MAG: hypothetical protein PQJ58_18165 [Spirochaetales bacterium]|nr:hypothetical protein [Spirochaetales bacterium]